MKVLISNTKVEQRITYRENKTEGVLNYDADNAYAQRIMVLIESSGQATRCARLLKKFIIGGGFTDQDFYKAVVNREGLTNDKLLRKIGDDKSYFNGFALHINWNANFKIDSIHHVPFEHCRLGIPDDMDYVGKIAVFNDWARWRSSRIEKKFIQWVDVWNPDPQVIKEQVALAKGWDKYKGQIFYFSTEGNGEYPKSPFDPVIEDVDSDALAKIFKNRNLRNNFLGTHLGKYKGRFDSDEERDAFTAKLNSFQGVENASNIMVIELDGQDDSFDLVPITTANLEKIYQYTEESARDNIRRVLRIPSVLVGDDIAGKLGVSNEIQDAVNYFNAATVDDRLEVEESFTEIFKHWKDPSSNPSNDYTIIPLRKFMIGEDPVESIPTDFLKDLTIDERRKLIGYKKSSSKGADKKLLADILGVGGTQAMTSIITDPILKPEQKINALILLFGLTTENATGLVLGTALPEQS